MGNASMKSLLLIVGTIFIIVGSAAMLLLIIVPAALPSFNDAPIMRSAFEVLFCKPGDTLADAHATYRPEPGKTVTTVSVGCVNNENQVTDVTEKPIIFGTVGFLVFFLAGIFMVSVGGGMKKKVISQTFVQTGFAQQSFAPTDGQQPHGFSMNAMGLDINMDDNGEVTVKTPDGRVLKGHQMQVNTLNSLGALSGVPVHLTERLQELKSALDSGLITQTEYDSKRQDILREM
jgi:hypothetical protein